MDQDGIEENPVKERLETERTRLSPIVDSRRCQTRILPKVDLSQGKTSHSPPVGSRRIAFIAKPGCELWSKRPK